MIHSDEQPDQKQQKQKQKQLTTIVCEGGGVKGIAYAGVAKALEDAGIYNKITTFAGSSAGSLAAGLMAVGYTAAEMDTILTTQNFNDFKDTGLWGPFRPFSEVYNLIKNWGIYYNEYLYTWYGGLLQTKVGNPDYTFANLFDDRGINLVITSTNYSQSKTIYFDYMTTPTVPIRIAVRASSTIPVFYQPFLYNGDILLDGGMLLNYAIDYFQDALDSTVGFRFSNDGATTPNRSPKSMTDYLVGIIELFLYQIQTNQITKRDWHHTVTIKTDINTTEFGITAEEKQKLIRSAYDSTILYLAKNGFATMATMATTSSNE